MCIRDRIAGERDKAGSELAAVTASLEMLQNQVAQLTKQRSASLAEARNTQTTVQTLGEQLKEKEKEIKELEQWGGELQATIQVLEEQLEQAYQQLPEGSYEEPNEQATEESQEESEEESGEDVTTEEEAG